MATLAPGLAACPRSPNCVSSEATDRGHKIEPFAFKGSAEAAWQAARAAVAGMARTKITAENDSALHAECKSALLGFVDDLDLRLRASEGLIAVRSASRIGYGDLGANRKRVEHLRAVLEKQGVLR